MDFMDIDQVVEVPDTPDRFPAACNTNGNNTGNGTDVSNSCHVENNDYFNERMRNEPREKGKSVTINGNRRLFVRPDNCSNSLGSLLGNSSSTKNFLPTVGNARHENGKGLVNSNVQRSTCQDGSSFVDLTGQNGRGHVPGKSTSQGVSGTGSSHASRKCLFPANGFSALDAFDTSNKSCRLNNTLKIGLRSDRGKGVAVGTQHKAENNSSSVASTSLKVNKQKRLVRNGCISPHNIAKSKQVAEKHDAGRVAKVVWGDAGTSASDGSSSTVDIKDLIAEAKDSHRSKGKVVSHHLSEEPDARSIHLSQRSSVILKEATDANKDLSVDTSRLSKESDGWRTTHNSMRKVDLPLLDSEPHTSRGKGASSSAIDQQKSGTVQRDHMKGSISNSLNNHFEDLEIVSSQCVCALPETVSRRAHQLGQFKERAQLTKRQREGVASSNVGECAISRFNDSEMVFLSPSGEPSALRSTRNKNRRGDVTSDPVVELDELSSEGGSTHHGTNEDSDVRALQVEADEMLARELQEQLYNEELAPAFGIDEVDSHHELAMALQQENSSRATRAGGRPASRGSSVSNLYQHSRSIPSCNPSALRGFHAQSLPSTRLAQLRGRFPGRPRTLSSTSTPRNSIFPPNMDVDMRMQILEALEAFNDMELPNDLLQVGREFNENDYEMLLALDENNHQHGGATRAQINNLPQSTVQGENLQECAICLETPTIGETIRHLPCLHRFHKDCIDQWLRRKTSCPVCKSSIT